MKDGTWVVVANSAKARILKAENNQTLIEMHQLLHPKSRLDEREIKSDRQGRTFDRVGSGKHMMEDHTPIKKQESIAFARHLANFLEDLSHKEKINRIYVAATPAFLGLLRQNLSKNIQNIIGGEIDKDITISNPQEIRKHLPYVL